MIKLLVHGQYTLQNKQFFFLQKTVRSVDVQTKKVCMFQTIVCGNSTILSV